MIKEQKKFVLIKSDPLAPDPARTFERIETEHPEVVVKWMDDLVQAESERLQKAWVRRCDRQMRKKNYRVWKSLQDLPIKARVIKMYSEKWDVDV